MTTEALAAVPPQTICFAHVAYQMAARFSARHTNLRHFQVWSLDELEKRIHEADVLVVSGLWRNFLLDAAPNLRFIQSIGAGVDQFPQETLRARGIRLASARGVNRNAVAEHALAHMLALSRHLHTGRDHQRQHQWRGMISDLAQREDELDGKTLLIVGLGEIGLRLAQLAKAFNLHVIGVKRDLSQSFTAVDELHSPADLRTLLPQADFVALTCPLTPETERLIDASALAAMKPSAYLINMARGRVVDEPALIAADRKSTRLNSSHLINMARGRVVDEPALIAALQAKQIAGAGLDTFWAEPLASDSPLWDFPQVLITPHTAGETRRYEEKVIDILLENLGRLARNETELYNQVV